MNSIVRRTGLAAMAVAAGGALAFCGSATASAAPAGDVTVQSAVVAGPFGDYNSCHTTQRDYQRYYTIYQGCFQLDTGSWIFTYDDGIAG